MVPVVVALGSNVGDSLGNLRRAARSLETLLKGVTASPIFRTRPMYVADQPEFLNAAIAGQTSLGPLALLDELKALEANLGREARSRYGPREIDLDLVSYGSLVYSGPRLQVPHPRTAERRFVLLPMWSVSPNLDLPGMGNVSTLLTQTECDAEDVVRIEDALFPIPSHG